MNRAEITKLLGDTLERTRFSGPGKYWAKEVTIDPFTQHTKRVDYMQFIPPHQCSVSAIEKGIFVCYEIKSCKEDVYSGNGLNFCGEKNYIVTTAECYKELLPDLRSGKFKKHLKECNPESSTDFGIMMLKLAGRDATSEFKYPHELDASEEWEFEIVRPCYNGLRKRSMAELLFCMVRSGR